MGIYRGNEKLHREVSKLRNFAEVSNLFKAANLMLVLPHTNTSEKRVFSMVKENKTPFRAFQHFMGSILTVKLANPNATKFKPDETLLKSPKSATNIIKDTRLLHHPLPQKSKKMMSLLFFWLYIFTYIYFVVNMVNVVI